MSEVKIVLKDARRAIHATRHGGFADAVIAALSAEPETIEELEAAVERFEVPGESGFFDSFSQGIDDEPYDAGLVVIDLAARLLVCDSTYWHPEPSGCVFYHDGTQSTDVEIDFHLSEDWFLSSQADGWRGLAEERRRERASTPQIDARAVLYGTAMLRSIAEGCWSGFVDPATAICGEPKNAESSDEADDDEGPAAKAVSQIHARWLMTPRNDLNGLAPRDVLLAKHKFIDWDLQDRANQWSRMHKCPPGLDRESHAFRFAGFGTQEIVVYYELVRDLVWACVDQIKTIGDDLRAKAMTVGDFLPAEIPRLDALREERWNRPDPECIGLSPRQVAEHERARLPEGMSGHEAVVDPDCPLCEMVADRPGPVFWHLDGCNMDPDFAFSVHRTKAEWEQEEEEYREFNRRFDAAQAERKRLCAETPECEETDGVWQFSHVDPEAFSRGPVFGMFGIGSRLAELIVDLKEPVEERALIDRLRRDFGNLRDVELSDDAARSASLREPVVQSFCETLDAVGETRKDLAEKCADLRQQLKRYAAGEEDGADDLDGLFDDDDVPFDDDDVPF